MFRIIRFSEQTTTTWSGGTTTELFISPKEASYPERNFDFRISTATVELEKSDFTSLSGFLRFLLILEGEMEIKHENQYSKHLKQFEFDFFDGYWKTTSEGKVRDFNIIYRPDLNVNVELISEARIHIQKQSKFHFLLILNDVNDTVHQFKKYDVIQIELDCELDWTEKFNFLEIRID